MIRQRAIWTILVGLLLVAGALSGPAGRAQPERKPARVMLLGVWDRVMPLIGRASTESDVPYVALSGADLADSDGESLDGIQVVYVLNFEAHQATRLQELFEQAKRDNPHLKIIPLSHRDTHVPLESAGVFDADPEVQSYWSGNGGVNLRRLFQYTAVTYLGAEGEVKPPLIIPDAGFYHPTLSGPLQDIKEYRKAVGWKVGSPVAVLLMQHSFWISEDTKVIDAETRALEDHGFNVAVIFGGAQEELLAMIRSVGPDIVIEDRHGSTWERPGEGSFLEELDVPYLRPISMLGSTVDEWRKDVHGLTPRDYGKFLFSQEHKGTIEPMVVGGLKVNIAGFRLHEPIYERIDRFASRAAAWVNLRRKKNSEKRVAIIYYNRGLGKDDLMRGSPTGAFLDAPESLARFLPRMRQEGYKVDPVPASAEEILQQIVLRGRNVAPWAQGELETMADQPGAVLVPAEQYETWYRTKLNEKLRSEIEKHFGPAPGKLMVVTRNDRMFIVLPNVQLGNVLLAALPVRGEKEDEKLLHSRDVPPPHNYLCFYWWLQEEFKAEAILHWGTHGTAELLPGKEAGLSNEDWPDICIGAMPVINPWIMDNIGESTLSRRRTYAALVDHVPPPAVQAGLPGELRDLQDAIHKFKTLETGLLREEFRKQISRTAVDTRVADTLEIEGLDERGLTDDEIQRIDAYTHEVESSTTPLDLHVLGEAPDDTVLVPYLKTCLGRDFLDLLASAYPVPDEHNDTTEHRLEWLNEKAGEVLYDCVIGTKPPKAELAEEIVFARDLTKRLRQSDVEITGILHALNGGYVPPGPGPDPARNPASVPAGRNLYGVNPEEIPTEPSWKVAVQLIDEMLKTKTPRKVGMDLSGMSTMRDFGVVEAQILYLLGVRPVWDRNRLVNDLEIIPREELGRPRIDVFIAMGGQYKENFASRVKLLDKAVRMVSELEEEDNYVRKGTEDLKQRLISRGYTEERAGMLSPARIFGTKPGNMSGTNILYLIPRSGVWDNDDEINSIYVNSMSYAYTGDVWGEQLDGLYEDAIQNTDTVIRVWASNMTSQLSNHHAFEYLGGLNLAVTKLTGREPDALIADVRDPGAARMRQFDEVLATNLRTELLNQNWIKGMKEHDYAGAGHMTALVKNTFGWDVTRSSSISDGVWEDIFDTYVQDKYNLGMREWFEKVNPHALQEIAATMLEAARKGYWGADEATLNELSKVYAESVAKFGPSAGLVSGGNEKLDNEIRKRLNAPGDAALVETFNKALEQSKGAPAETRVRGPVLEEQKPDTKQQQQSTVEEEEFPRHIAIFAAVMLATLFLVGFLLRPSISGSKQN